MISDHLGHPLLIVLSIPISFLANFVPVFELADSCLVLFNFFLLVLVFATEHLLVSFQGRGQTVN